MQLKSELLQPFKRMALMNLDVTEEALSFSPAQMCDAFVVEPPQKQRNRK